MQKFYQIFYDIIYNYNLRQRNYEKIVNVNSVKNFNNLKDIDDLTFKPNHYLFNFTKIYGIFCKMNNVRMGDLENIVVFSDLIKMI